MLEKKALIPLNSRLMFFSVSAHVIRFKFKPDIFPLCVPPPSYDPNPQV